ncbi:type III secretion system export apparatus subunit SctT [Acerihabitans arboris]|uniref:SpaR/YscT/HrcT type III secretion system export apparatus protein n=1 Tax=Acerihabitans arboris TaxID=2691583 RepID=A0A845SDR8_9GAMM|nr:type III secretion system export apparatus subunit SctT [Acerihabitans arboris]NDL61517.1 SpaR/YscT/HrcT type III secretion system export apparatus protein [Acerihabitans arboris]
MDFSAWLDLQHWLSVMILTSARITPVFLLLPFLTSNIISMNIRMPVIIFIGASLWPYSLERLPADEINFLAVLAQELFIGLILGILFALPFWIMHGLGSVIDHQRGATVSSTFDPMSGVDTSELSNLFNLFAGALFLAGGGMLLLLETFQQSYLLCDPLQTCTPALKPVLGIVGHLMGKIIILASPVLACLLLSEMILGLLSRFAPQMNAFSISLTIKSMIAFMVLILYFSPYLPDAFKSLAPGPGVLDIWLKPD